jgi:hypothetical protein
VGLPLPAASGGVEERGGARAERLDWRRRFSPYRNSGETGRQDRALTPSCLRICSFINTPCRLSDIHPATGTGITKAILISTQADLEETHRVGLGQEEERGGRDAPVSSVYMSSLETSGLAGTVCPGLV